MRPRQRRREEEHVQALIVCPSCPSRYLLCRIMVQGTRCKVQGVRYKVQLIGQIKMRSPKISLIPSDSNTDYVDDVP
jgi:hypothetical protein